MIVSVFRLSQSKKVSYYIPAQWEIKIYINRHHEKLFTEFLLWYYFFIYEARKLKYLSDNQLQEFNLTIK